MPSVQSNILAIRNSLPEGVKLLVVSKFRPLEQMLEAYEAGCRDFAESRPLEFEQKVAALPKDISWHFIGHLQTNKLKHVLPYASLIHSVDSIHLLEAISHYATAHSMSVNVLLEIHIGAEQTKQGFTPEEAIALIDGGIDRFKGVKIRGLMGMASHTTDGSVVEGDFANLEKLFNAIRLSHPQLDDFTILSAGMSDDYRTALRHGSTMVRIGSSIFNV